MIKSIKRFVIKIARYSTGSISRVIGTYGPRKGKTTTAKESSKTNSFANKEGQQPNYLTEDHMKNSEAAIKQIVKWDKRPLTLEGALKRQRARDDGRDTRPPKNISNQYLTEAHRKSSEAKQETIKKWQESPTDWEKMDKLTQEHFNQHGQKNPNCGYNSFDWTTLTKNELDALYHQIIDKALENYEYRLYVLFRWKINHEQFHYKAAASLATRIRQEEQRMKKHDIISTYFKKRWTNMTPEEVEADRKWIIEQGRLRNPN